MSIALIQSDTVPLLVNLTIPAGQMDAAARRAVEADPNDSEAVASLAWAFLFVGNLPAALDYADRALSLNRNSAFGQFLKGAALAYLGQGQEEQRPSISMSGQSGPQTR